MNLDKTYLEKTEAQDIAAMYNMGSDYSVACVIRVANGWKIVIKYYGN